MAPGISDAEIDSWYRKGISAGASGGKLLGAGNGGFLMFYASITKHQEIKKALSGLKVVPFSFDSQGSQIIHYQPNNSNL